MRFFNRLFGRKKNPPATGASRVEPSSPLPPSYVPAQARKVAGTQDEGKPIQVFDSYGRALLVPRSEWRKSVLPGTIEKAWNNADELYGVILSALNDGFIRDVYEAAKHLHRIDPKVDRGVCVWAIVLRLDGQLDESEKVLRGFLAKHGDDGAVLTNLAKVYADRKDQTKTDEVLWRAMEVDPNHENGLLWFASIARDRLGKEAGIEAFRRVSEHPGSWRAQLWLARNALEKKDLAGALGYYRQSIERAGSPVPGDMLMQISGDLGNSGYMDELLKMTQPIYNATFHGIQVGNNLIKANLELGRIDAAKALLEELYTFKRPDWKGTLAFWDREIAKARLESKELAADEPVQMSLSSSSGPIWLASDSPLSDILPGKSKICDKICFLGSTVQKHQMPKVVQQQLSDSAGRISRAVPLFLAEQVHFATALEVTTLTPRIVKPNSGFAVSGHAWEDQDAVGFANKDHDAPSGYVVVTHVVALDQQWSIELRLIRTLTGERLATFNVPFSVSQPHEAVTKLTGLLLSALAEHDISDSQPSCQFYQVPGPEDFANYLLRLEQLLAIRCTDTDDVEGIHGEHEIVDGNLHLCLSCPKNPTVRFVLAQTLRSLRRLRPLLIKDYGDKVNLLQKEKPLDAPLQGIVQKMLDEALRNQD